MNYTCKAALLSLLLFALPLCKAIAQPIPVGDVKEEQYRMLQLLSDSTVSNSLSNRAIWRSAYDDIFSASALQKYSGSWWANPLGGYVTKGSKSWRFGLYDPVFTNTLNTQLPYGGNNGSAWYGRGLNTEFQGGFYFTSKYFTATFRPHITYSQNSDFPTPRFIPRDNNGNPRYVAIFNQIDMPFRFGPDSYSDFNLGQTSVRIHYKSLEAGLSNETLWWGPGIQNALVLSNNAPGLRHAFFGTRSPLLLPLGIGDLEFKIIWAEPKDSKYFEATQETDHQRFTTGTNFIYTPGFAPNLNIGFSLMSHEYIPNGGLSLHDFENAIPLAAANSRATVGTESQNILGSVYFRWAFPESNAEVYGEYFREDNFYNARDLFMEPDHDRAYTIGFQKIVESDGWFNVFKINGEINDLVPGRIDGVRPQTYYYSHSQVQQGHTNEGQVLGAAVGPGSASQYMGVKGFFKNGALGMFLQREAVNDFFYFEYYDFYYFYQDRSDLYGATAAKDIYHHRINLNIGIDGNYKWGPWLLSGKVTWNKNYNYGRFSYGDFEDLNFNTVDKHDVVNLQFQLSVRYYIGGNLF